MIPDPDRFVANLRLLNDVLAESPIADHYQLVGGLLLGMEREGRPLAHDHDADFFFLEQHRAEMEASLPMLVRAGFEKWRRYFSNEGRVSEYSFRKDGGTFDFFCYWPTGAGFLSFYVFAGGRKPEQIEKRYPVLPYVRREFVGCTWRVPQDIDTALDIAHKAESGAVHINRPTIQDEPCPPFGGQGLSGFGREGTEADLDILTQWKWITLRMGKQGSAL
jgi:hypothetical protein